MAGDKGYSVKRLREWLVGQKIEPALADRFDETRRSVVRMFPGRKRPGGSYRGFVAALTQRSETLLAKVAEHLPTGVVWQFTRGPARSSERDHLRQMLPNLPHNTLLIADAGFTGYDLLTAIRGGGIRC